MSDRPQTFVYLPGASGGATGVIPSLVAAMKDPVHFEPIGYPGWQRSVEQDFSAELLVEELAAAIEAKIPSGPIRLMGMSIGGHLAYAAALRLKAKGREIAGLCVFDAFMIRTTQPTAGWQGRALAQAMDLLRKGRLRDLFVLLRSKVWRALIRLAGPRLWTWLRKLSESDRMRSLVAVDDVAEQELNMRLLIQRLTPWLVQLDRAPQPLIVPAALLRTKDNEGDDAAWVLRCPQISIHEVPGTHHTLFDAEHIGALCRELEAAAKMFDQPQHQSSTYGAQSGTVLASTTSMMPPAPPLSEMPLA